MSDTILITPDPETADLLPGYLERRRMEVTILDEAVAREDFARLQTIGHNVKGTAGSYGIPGLGELAESLHRSALSKDAAACRAAIEAYRAYLARLEIGPAGEP